MPKYTFHFPTSPHVEPIQGEYAGPDEVRLEAVRLAGDLIKDQVADFWHSPERRIFVTDEQGLVVCTLRFIGTTGEP